jgi:hypothetical protein
MLVRSLWNTRTRRRPGRKPIPIENHHRPDVPSNSGRSEKTGGASTDDDDASSAQFHPLE